MLLAALVLAAAVPQPIGRAEASSTLEGALSPAHVLDEDPATAWCEGKPDAGVGEWLRLVVPAGAPGPAMLEIANGYQKTPALLARNRAPKELEVVVTTTWGQTRRAIVKLEGKAGWQPLFVPGGLASAVAIELRIRSVHKGSKFTDTCVSGLRAVPRASWAQDYTSGKDEALAKDAFDVGAWTTYGAADPDAWALERSGVTPRRTTITLPVVRGAASAALGDGDLAGFADALALHIPERGGGEGAIVNGLAAHRVDFDTDTRNVPFVLSKLTVHRKTSAGAATKVFRYDGHGRLSQVEVIERRPGATTSSARIDRLTWAERDGGGWRVDKTERLALDEKGTWTRRVATAR